MISIHAPPRGATVHGVCWGYWNLISIHAPPRGATKLIDALKGEYGISIHAPPRGATPSRCRNESRGSRFQFTPLREGRHRLDGEEGSIYIFQFTPLREGRHRELIKKYYVSKFQFTPLREGRRPHLEQLGRHIYFNSRPSARGDRLLWADLLRNRISIHAPPRGATMRALLRSGVQNISIHAPPRGATCRFQNSREAHIFQFTPLREGRLGG